MRNTMLLRIQPVAILVAAFSFLPGISHAELSSDASTAITQRRLGDSLPEDVSGTSPVGATAPIVVFEASRDDMQVVARYANIFDTYRYEIKLAGPIDSEADSAAPADLDGLANSATVEFSVAGVFGEPRYDDSVRSEHKNIWKAASDKLGHKFPDTNTLYNVVYLEQLKDVDRTMYNALYKRYMVTIQPFSVPVFGVSGKMGQKNFEYLDRDSLEKASQDEVSYSFSAYGGLLTRSDWMLLAGYRREKSYKAGDEATILTPIGENGASLSTTASLGQPTVKKSDIVYAEARKYFGRFGVNPRVSHLFDDDVTGVECGFYFTPNEDGLLIGGVAAGWRSDTDEFVASVMIGSTLRYLD